MRARLLSGALFILIGSLTLFLATCDKTVNSGFEDSIELYSYLEPIEGASNATMVVNKGKDGNDSYFQVEISDIATNHLLKSGTHGAWCLEWKKPMRSNNDEHKGVKWYSSIGNEKWRPMNYFFSIKGELEAADPDLTFREVQAVVWSLAGYMGIAPEFDVDKLPDSELPGRLMLDGKPNFSKEKVQAIVSRVKSEYASPAKSKATEEEGCNVGETEEDQQNVCVPIEPVVGVSELCQEGSFTPKGALNLGASIDMTDSVSGSIVNSFSSIGFSARVFTDLEIENRIPEQEGINVLVISRKVTINPVSEAYVEGIKSFIASGGSILAEYDGAGMLFSEFLGDDAVLGNMDPALNLFTGTINGGSVLFPEADSETHIINPSHSLMSDVPSPFINGFRRAYALTNYNEEWLTSVAEYTSTGNFGFPEGTYPAILGGRCGSGRIVIFTMNYFNALTQAPIDQMTLNAVSWVLGNE